MDPIDFAFAVVALAWTAVALRGLRDLAWLARLPPLDAQAARTLVPRVSVVVPARDEEGRIGATVERLLAQRGVELEVVVVDDRSRDDTAAIVAAAAERDARVRLVRVLELPAGWLGKPHACQRGGETARGEWILFTDGDVWLGADVVARAVAAAERTGAQHVTLSAHAQGASVLTQAGMCVFGGALATELARANRDDPASGAGIGAFNLVRADAWRAIGGHAALAFEVVDDLRLGLLLRRAGFRTRAWLGGDEVAVVWATSLFGIVRALEKNFFAQLGYSVSRALFFAGGITVLWLAALAGPLNGGVAGWCAAGALALTVVPGLVAGRRTGIRAASALLAPLCVGVLPLAILNSAWSTLRAGGVSWRGTFYPLAELRARRVA